MAEAVNCICHYCGQQGHKKPDCPTHRADLETKELDTDEVNEHNMTVVVVDIKEVATTMVLGGGGGAERRRT